MRDERLAAEMSQRVLQLLELNGQIVFRVEPARMHRTLEVERQPFLNTAAVRALRKIEEQREIEHQRRRQNAVPTQKIDLQLHGVTEPAEQIDIVPAFLVVAAR